MLSRYLLLFTLSGMILRANAESIKLTIDQARECLKTTQPNPEEIIDVDLLSNPSIPERKEDIKQAKIYQMQMASIKVLLESKSSDNVVYLIPFLSYVSKTGSLEFTSTHQRTLEEAKSTFPVFAAMFDMPGAAHIVASYCLDTRNPEDSRMTAFWALKYLDNTTFKKISNDFNNQWDQDNPKMKHLLMIIESGPFMFDGMVNIKEATQE